MFKKILLFVILGVLMLVPFGIVQSGQPFYDRTCWNCDPCDCCFDDVRIEIGEMFGDIEEASTVYHPVTITPLKDRRPAKQAVAFQVFIWSARNDEIYGHESFQLDDINSNSSIWGALDASGSLKTWTIFWRPDKEYQWRLTGFNYEDEIYIAVIMPSGCVKLSPPIIFDFGAPPPPQ